MRLPTVRVGTALVYVAAFATEKGETLGEATGESKDAVLSSALVPLHYLSAGSDVVRSMAERAGASTTEVEGSHVIMVSQPQAVADVILEAVAAVGAAVAAD